MLWFLFAFLTAFFKSVSDALSKKGVQEIDEYVLSWVLRAFTLPFLLPALLFIEIPAIGPQFWLALAVSGGLNVFTTILYMKSIKYSDLSVVIPLTTFTPLFLLATSPIILGEIPDLYGFLGVVLIVVGAYALKIEERSAGFLEPFRALVRERGPQLMLLAAFLWSITSNFDKIGVQNSSPFFWVVATNLFLSAALFPIMLYKSQNIRSRVRANTRVLLPIGLVTSLYLFFQMSALALAFVSYVIAIKRFQILFSVFWGHRFFGEEGVRKRLLGAAVMVAGVALITVL